MLNSDTVVYWAIKVNMRMVIIIIITRVIGIVIMIIWGVYNNCDPVMFDLICVLSTYDIGYIFQFPIKLNDILRTIHINTSVGHR